MTATDMARSAREQALLQAVPVQIRSIFFATSLVAAEVVVAEAAPSLKRFLEQLAGAEVVPAAVRKNKVLIFVTIFRSPLRKQPQALKKSSNSRNTIHVDPAKAQVPEAVQLTSDHALLAAAQVRSSQRGVSFKFNKPARHVPVRVNQFQILAVLVAEKVGFKTPVASSFPSRKA